MNRTQVKNLREKMSDEKTGIFSGETIKTFQVWQRAFRRLKRGGLADLEFSQVMDAGSDVEDLEWSLFNVLLWYEVSRAGSHQTKLFHSKLDKVLSDFSRLSNSLESLVNLPYLSGNYLRTCLDYLSSMHKDDQLAVYKLPDSKGGSVRYQFLRSGVDEQRETCFFLASLYGWAERFELIRALGKLPRDPASTSASEAEALLVCYIKKSTRGKYSLKHASALMTAASEARGSKTREYDLVPFARRFSRFKKKSRDRMALIDFVLMHYSSTSKRSNTNLITVFYETQLAWGQQETGMRLGRKDNF